ncbi:MAG: hypothetical protein NW203_15665 [Hyphomonadaceae bacterium]|nr:hypothetical protein [Hyphomonadaceae bacterium]
MFDRDKTHVREDEAAAARGWSPANDRRDDDIYEIDDAPLESALDDALDAESDDDILAEDADGEDDQPSRVDWSGAMFGVETPEQAIARSATPAPDDDAIPKPAPAPGFSWTATMGGLLALGWIAAAVAAPLSFYGLDAVMRMDPALHLALAAAAIGPAALIWLTASAVAEAARAGRLAAALVTLSAAAPRAEAQRLDPTALDDAHAQVRSLNAAVDAALRRLSTLDTSAARHAETLNAAFATTGPGADMLARITQERDAVAALHADLRAQSEMIANTVNRQVRLMREASKLVRGEIEGAEDVLDNHLVALKSSATIVQQRTADMRAAAEASSAANAKLEDSLGASLHTLSEATRLTDAARQSTDQAASAAHAAATAVREATHGAIADAKRAAGMIRREAQGLESLAGETLDKLRQAADAARAAAQDAEAAADKHAAAISKRLNALAGTAKAARAEAPRPRAPAAARRTPAPALSGDGDWANLTPRAPRSAPAPAPAAERRDLFRFTPQQSSDDALIADALDVIAAAGVRIEDALLPADLDRIARCARDGASARRRAVLDAAPGAVQRIARHLRHDREALRAATAFRVRPDLAKGDRGDSSDAVCAYLLIDAALTP